MQTNLSKRLFLRGLGASIALPMMEMAIPSARAAATAGKIGITENGMPLRLGFLYVPNGVIKKYWDSTSTDQGLAFGQTLKPVEAFKNDLQIFNGFKLANGTAGRDGAGDHARANATFLTTMRPRKTAGSDIHLGVSVDQVVARQMELETRFPSIEISCDGIRKSGRCDSGYSCAYQFNISWKSATTPQAPESNPRLLFERLFGSGSHGERQKSFWARAKTQRSILDFVMEDAKSLQHQLGRNDQHKLDEYLTGIRELELRIAHAEKMGAPVDPNVPTPDANPDSYEDRIRLLADTLVLAFQTDSTRVASFMLAHDGSNRDFSFIGVPEGHHSLSHHQGSEEKIEKVARIDQFYSRQLGYILEKLRDTKDADGSSLLHNSMMVYGSGLSDGNRHKHDELPIVLAGHGGGKLSPGHLRNAGDMPLANLYTSLMNKMGVDGNGFGDSTGIFTQI